MQNLDIFIWQNAGVDNEYLCTVSSLKITYEYAITQLAYDNTHKLNIFQTGVDFESFDKRRDFNEFRVLFSLPEESTHKLQVHLGRMKEETMIFIIYAIKE